MLINSHNIDTLNFSAPTSSASAVSSSTVRHSYQGLPEIFSSISSFLGAYMVELCDICARYRYHDQAPGGTLLHDVLVNSVLLPTMHLCANVHSHKNADGTAVVGSNIFNVAIPNIFHNCYAAAGKFVGTLDDVVAARSDAKKHACDSIKTHPKVLALNAQWNTNIYYQLRSKEIVSRVTASCSVVKSFGFGSSLVFKSVYGVGAKAPVAPASGGVQATLSAKQLADIMQMVETNLAGVAIRTPLVSGLLTELHTLLHEEVFIDALTGEFLQLTCRLFGMLRVFVLDSLGYYHKDGGVALHFLNDVSGGAADGAVSLLDLLAAPVACNTVTLTTEAAGAEKAGGLYAHTASELLCCGADLLRCMKYVQRFFVPMLAAAHTAASSGGGDKLGSYVADLVELQCKKLHSTIPAICDHTLLGLLSDLRVALQAGVEAVPTRYRMTNKPAPTACNAYVLSLTDRFSAVYREFVPVGNAWLEHLQPTDTECYNQVSRFVLNFVHHSATMFVFYIQKSLKVGDSSSACFRTRVAGLQLSH
jgi:hypothetical protein